MSTYIFLLPTNSVSLKGKWPIRWPQMFSFESSTPLYVLLLSLPLALFYHRYFYSQPIDQAAKRDPNHDKPLKTIMQPPRDDLAPPKDDPFTLEELKRYDGSDASKPIYVAIKGVYFLNDSLTLFHHLLKRHGVWCLTQDGCLWSGKVVQHICREGWIERSGYVELEARGRSSRLQRITGGWDEGAQRLARFLRVRR